MRSAVFLLKLCCYVCNKTEKQSASHPRLQWCPGVSMKNRQQSNEQTCLAASKKQKQQDFTLCTTVILYQIPRLLINPNMTGEGAFCSQCFLMRLSWCCFLYVQCRLQAKCCYLDKTIWLALKWCSLTVCQKTASCV